MQEFLYRLQMVPGDMLRSHLNSDPAEQKVCHDGNVVSVQGRLAIEVKNPDQEPT